MRLLFLTPLLLSIGAPSAAPQDTREQRALPAPVKVGDKLPPIALEGLSQTDALSFSDFYGRAVLLEFFAHWCGPCASSIPHVNKLQEKYGRRGFSVVGVTSEPDKKTRPWIEKHGAKYAYGYDTSGELHRLFRIQGIPFSALVDPFGTVLWTGHPMRLADEKVEAALEHALEKPVWQWPEDARPLVKTLASGAYAAALREAEALAPRDGFDPVAIVRGRIGPLVARFERLLEAQDHAGALHFGARLEVELANLPEAEKVAQSLRTLRSDAGLMREVAALERLTALELRAADVRGPAQAAKLRPDVEAFVKEQAGQKLERRAQALLEALDRALDKLKKKS